MYNITFHLTNMTRHPSNITCRRVNITCHRSDIIRHYAHKKRATRFGSLFLNIISIRLFDQLKFSDPTTGYQSFSG